MLGDVYLYGLEKPNKDVRPIGVGAALRRLAGRVQMHMYAEEIGDILTSTPVPADYLEEAGFAADTPSCPR